MNKATRFFAATIGIIAGMMGVEHGIGELLQGTKTIDSGFILSWPNSAFYEILGGEPAMTLFRTYSSTGIFAILFSILFILGVLFLMPRKYSFFALLPVTSLMLISGAGFGPPLVGIIASLMGTKINSKLKLWTRIPSSVHAAFAKLWPFAFALCILGWIMVFPGAPILSKFLGSQDMRILFIPLVLAFGMIPLTLWTGFSKDILSRQDRSAILMTKKEVALAFLSDASLGKVADAFENYIHKDFRHHLIFVKGDRTSFRTAIEENYRQFPDKKYEARHALEDGDLVSIHGKVSLGARIFGVIHIFKFLDGKIIESWEASQEDTADSVNENGLF